MLNRGLVCFITLSPFIAVASNTTNQSFNQAKKQLLLVYQDHRETLYCGAAFDAKGLVISSPGFTTKTHLARAKKIEWEHVVPAENFGKAFAEWRAVFFKIVVTLCLNIKLHLLRLLLVPYLG
ncbi:hypothetical protein L2744_17850 [Shewanella profunda]|uniref:hypothetical protein n=1 Tax=Shewanella profunda TaxID=254793 RepID=UPI00200D9A26|nr:hypothetical protein [Shewanella profunda]MCL1091434.1 hypothetical protein [Shewanella profunda]